MKTYDLIVIGAGSGLDVAVEAAGRGMKVALVEEGPLGGTCLNRGCIPSKIILHAADVAEEIRHASRFGITAAIKGIQFSKVTSRATNIVDKDAREIEASLRSGHNPTLYKTRAHFISERTVQVGKNVIKGNKIVLAAGTRTFIPPIQGLDKVPYLTSTEALRLTKQPKKLIVVGGGYIGAELGYFFRTMGSNVQIVQRNKLLIPNVDKEIAEAFTSLWKKKYTVLTEAEVTKVEKKGKNIIVHTSINGTPRKVSGDALLLATGRTPNSDLLHVNKTNVKLNKKGYVEVNQFMETSNRNIWALGDIAGIYQFKHSANLEGEYVLRNLFGKKTPVDYYPMPYAIFTNPQVAGVGITEQEAAEKKLNYVTSRYDYKNTGMGTAMAEEDGFVKFIVDRKTKEILGCHIMGPQASILIHEVVVAMKANRKRALDILRNAVHVHPALSEVVERGAGSVPI